MFYVLLLALIVSIGLNMVQLNMYRYTVALVTDMMQALRRQDLHLDHDDMDLLMEAEDYINEDDNETN